jgi:hypothetical protein
MYADEQTDWLAAGRLNQRSGLPGLLGVRKVERQLPLLQPGLSLLAYRQLLGRVA